jgi:hypothetical protein
VLFDEVQTESVTIEGLARFESVVQTNAMMLRFPSIDVTLWRKREMKLTPVLIVDEIEKSLLFWVDRIGFTKTAEMPEGDKAIPAPLTSLSKRTVSRTS